MPILKPPQYFARIIPRCECGYLFMQADLENTMYCPNEKCPLYNILFEIPQVELFPKNILMHVTDFIPPNKK